MQTHHPFNINAPVLGIESSCDETGVAIVTPTGAILANQLYSQLDEHAVFGGVVPEIAARAHLERMDPMIAAALDEAGLNGADLGGVAAACGPGLIGGLMVGATAGKTMAALYNTPFLAVNHLEAHVLTPRLATAMQEQQPLAFPYLTLLVSGGHSQLLLARGVGDYIQLGTTRDDALGEAFDKCARMLGLAYPGGPALEAAARQCRDIEAACARFPLPRPMLQHKVLDFSFSGLKTALREHIDALTAPDDRAICDLAAAFQQAIVEILATRTQQAIAHCMHRDDKAPQAFVVCGGVAANTAIRDALRQAAAEYEIACHLPPLELCADNGAMIAWAGIEQLRQGRSDGLDFAPRPRWALAG
jgi:N6-L-threonylcarbamoyladenine synthase